jgi:hypothetical protein
LSGIERLDDDGPSQRGERNRIVLLRLVALTLGGDEEAGDGAVDPHVASLRTGGHRDLVPPPDPRTDSRQPATVTLTV